MPDNRGMDKEDVVHTQWNMIQPEKAQSDATCSSVHAIRDYHAKWSKAQRKSQTQHDITRGIQTTTPAGVPTKQKQDSQTENRCVVAKEEEGKGGKVWEFGISRCKLVYIG